MKRENLVPCLDFLCGRSPRPALRGSKSPPSSLCTWWIWGPLTSSQKGVCYVSHPVTILPSSCFAHWVPSGHHKLINMTSLYRIDLSNKCQINRKKWLQVIRGWLIGLQMALICQSPITFIIGTRDYFKGQARVLVWIPWSPLDGERGFFAVMYSGHGG